MTNSHKDDNDTGTRIASEILADNAGSPELFGEILKSYPREKQSVAEILLGISATVSKLASKAISFPERIEKVLLNSPERAQMIQEAGASLRDLRQVAGLTLKELSDALHLKDQSFLAAVENGTATLSFELILRLSAVLARHDPIPFITRFTRTYNPEVWAVLQDWGLGRVPLQFERERQFINIYRSHDEARKLSDESFARVLEFTRAAFEMALQFAMKNDA